MRIIGGELGGRRLLAPKGGGTRPTAERVRESLFSILGAPPTDCRVLDLFAGAGTLGLEAVSRGAVSAVFVERSKRATTVLRKNIASLGLNSIAQVHPYPVAAAIPKLRGDRFDWIFADPPYAREMPDDVVALVESANLLCADGIMVIEHDRRRESAVRCGSLVRIDQRRYGDTELSFYSHLSHASADQEALPASDMTPR